MNHPYQSRKQVSGKLANYTIPWSPYVEMDRYLLHSVIPSEGGIFQVFLNRKGQLHQLQTELSWYGGLRNRLRELIDPLYMGHVENREIIQNSQCFARYCLFLSLPDMNDVMHFLCGSEPSGRYDEVFVNERDCYQVRKA
jgi:hypothetical protein